MLDGESRAEARAGRHSKARVGSARALIGKQLLPAGAYRLGPCTRYRPHDAMTTSHDWS